MSKKDLLDICLGISRTCRVCQSVKPPCGGFPKGTLDFWPIPSQVFQSLAMDFLSLPTCTYRNITCDFCFVVVDRLSGYIVAAPCTKKGLTAQDAAHLFLDKCVHFMGLPLEILSDNDNLLTSEFFQEICRNVGIVQHRAIRYRPKGNGRAERAVRTVVSTLRTCLQTIPGSCWLQILPWCNRFPVRTCVCEPGRRNQEHHPTYSPCQVVPASLRIPGVLAKREGYQWCTPGVQTMVQQRRSVLP